MFFPNLIIFCFCFLFVAFLHRTLIVELNFFFLVFFLFFFKSMNNFFFQIYYFLLTGLISGKLKLINLKYNFNKI